MKEIISGKKLEEITKEAVNLICDAVGSTLGPSGNNVIINSDLSPYITNDGATIARNLESSDKKINTILELVKEASLKTDEEVGDGTTTTLVLLQSIYNEGLKEKNRIQLKKELNNKLDYIIEKINSKKRKPTKEDLINIATISSGEESIGKLVYEVYSKMNNSFSIKLDESKNNKTYYEIKKGYTIEDVEISNLYFKNKNEIVLDNIYILILRGYLNDLEQISDIINEGLVRNKNIVILADDYSENIKNEVLLYYLENNKNIFLFKTPDYASRKESIEEDIRVLSNSTIKNIDYERIYFSDLGKVDKVIISKENISIINDNDVNDRIVELKKELKNIRDDYEKEFVQGRISKLEKGIATIYVGGNTKTEIKERTMRYQDALRSIETAQEGVVTGEGITLLQISDEIDNNILKKALKAPFIKILENSGYEYESIMEEIIKSDYKKIFNLEKGELEQIENNIIDPAPVLIESIRNSISIATMLLTTNYLVINEEMIIDNNTL